MNVPVVAVDFGATLDPRLPRRSRRRSAARRRRPPRGARAAARRRRHIAVGLGPPARRARRRARARLGDGPVASIGIDTWGVDYGLLDDAASWSSPRSPTATRAPTVYRRSSSGSASATAVRAHRPAALAFNTIFQLAAHDAAQLARAAHVVMLPELVVAPPHGRDRRRDHERREPPDCSTCTHARLVRGACDAIGARPARSCPPSARRDAGRRLAGRPRASRRAATTPRPRCWPADVADDAFVSTGTWLLVGREQPDPDTCEAARRAGFSNEQGALGGIRLLRNVAGWWLVEECRREWGDAGPRRAPRRSRGVPTPAVLSTRPTSASSRPTDMAAELRDARRARARRRAAPRSCAPRSSRWPRPPRRSSTSLPASTGQRARGDPCLRRRIRVAALPRRAPTAHRPARRRPARSRRPRSATRSPRASRSGVFENVDEARATLADRRGGLTVNVDALERLELMRQRLDTDGRVRVTDLATELDVSEMTIRRDLDMLVDEGIAQRVRGGAVAVGPQEFATRVRQHARPRRGSPRSSSTWSGPAAPSASTRPPRCSGSRPASAEARDLTVLTNGPDTFRALQEHPGVTALLTGGELDPRTGSLVGPLASRAAHDVLLRRLFVSAAAVDPDPRLQRVDARRGRGEARARGLGRRSRARRRRVEARPPGNRPRASPSSGSTSSSPSSTPRILDSTRFVSTCGAYEKWT